MDAKPQRPARSIRVFAEKENVVPQAAALPKTIHSRNKSSPALSTLSHLNGLRFAAKRSAFNDLSNLVRSSKDDTSLANKNLKPTGVIERHNLTEEKKNISVNVTSGIGSRSASESGPEGNGTKSRGTYNEGSRVPLQSQIKASQPSLTVHGKSIRAQNFFESSAQSLATTTNSEIPSKQVKRLPNPSSGQIPCAPPSRVRGCVVPCAHVEIGSSNGATLLRPLQTAPPELPELSISGSFGDLDRAFANPLTVCASAASHVSQVHAGHTTSEDKRILPSVCAPEISANTHQEVARQLKHVHEAQGVDQYHVLARPITTNHNAESVSVIDSAADQLSRPLQGHVKHCEGLHAANLYEDGEMTIDSQLRDDFTASSNDLTIYAPQSTWATRQELEVARELMHRSKTTQEIEDEAWDTTMVAEYGDEIFLYMRRLEAKMLPDASYMDNQREIQWSMRTVLIDWIVQVHHRFNLLPETLFLTINYIDRFLSRKAISLSKLQLVGATAIFLAAKYEEIDCPSVKEIEYMVDGGYDAEEILKAERFMLTMLEFEMGWPGPMSFLRRISKADDYDLETRTLAKYFLEVTIMEKRMIACLPSFLAAASHCLARVMLRKGGWSSAHVYYSGYTYSQIHRIASFILDCCWDPREHHGAIYEKYLDKRFKRASLFVESEVKKGFRLPSVSAHNSGFLLSDVAISC